MLRRLFAVTLGITIICLTTGPGYAFRDDIVAAWTLDEGSGNDIHDVSGNGNDGELTGGADWSDGKFGKALNFDGSSGYIEIPFSESMRVLNQGDFTFAAWFASDIVPAENKEVFQQGDGPGRTWLFIAADGGEIRSWLGAAGTYSGVSVEAGQWYHGAVVVTEGGDTDTVQIYINGEPSGDPLQKGMEDSEGSYFIGCHKNLSNFWDGVIDEVVLISKALNEAEIKDLMTNGIPTAAAVESVNKLSVSWGSIKGN